MKLLVSVAGGGVKQRDYTTRHDDQAACTLAIDFALHDAGPATAWARGASVRRRAPDHQTQGVANSLRRARWLLIGDETALPAIGRFCAEAALDVEITSVVAVRDERE